MVPPAPGLLRMMTLCPSRWERRVPISRNVMSIDPPAANGTTISIAGSASSVERLMQ